MRFLIVAISLLAPGLLFAVEHSGTVRAADQFIPGATVTATQGGAKIVTYTDENGRYSLDLTPGVWNIQISMFGFKTLTGQVTIKDQFTSRDWTLEMPRPGEPTGTGKPAATAAKKPDATPAAATPAAATPAKPAATPAAAATTSSAQNGSGQGGRSGRGTQPQAATQNGRGRGRGNQQQTGQPAFQNADVTATDAGAQALAQAGSDTPPDLAGMDSSDALMMNGSTSGGLGEASDEQQMRMQMGGRGGRGGAGGPVPFVMGGRGGGGGFGGNAGGGPVEPGTYMVRLTVGDKQFHSSVDVLEDIWMRPQ